MPKHATEARYGAWRSRLEAWEGETGTHFAHVVVHKHSAYALGCVCDSAYELVLAGASVWIQKN